MYTNNQVGKDSLSGVVTQMITIKPAMAIVSLDNEFIIVKFREHFKPIDLITRKFIWNTEKTEKVTGY